MSFDAHQNFAYSTVLTPPIPAASGTSLTVATGEGANFPAAPFNCTVWPADAQATSANAEIVRVTAIVGDVLTITRAQEGSSARTIIAGDQIAETVTAKTLTDIEAAVEIVSNAVSVETSARGAAVNTVSNALSVEVVARTAKDDSLSAAVDVVSAAATSADNHANTVSAAVDIVSNALSAAGILQQDVSVTLGSAGFDIKVNPSAVVPGLLAFNVFNAGFGHELLVIRTEQTAADLVSLASVAGGTFDETGYDVRVDTGSLAHLVSARANVVLEAGHYVLVCNEPGHTHLGMALDWTVKDLVSIHDRVNTLSAGLVAASALASVADAHASAASAAAIANDASVSAAIMADVASHLASASVALKADLTSVSAIIKADITSVSAVVKADAVSADTALSAVIKADALSADRVMSAAIKTDTASMDTALSTVIKADITSVSAVIKTDALSADTALSAVIKADAMSADRAMSIVVKADVASVSAAIMADVASHLTSTSALIKADIASVSAAIKTDAASMDTALSAVIKTDVVSAINVLSNLASNWVSAAFNASTATSSPAISNAASNAASANTALSTVIKADVASVSAAIKTDTASMDTALSAVIANVSSRTTIGGATSTRGIQSAINNLSNNDSVMKSAYAGASTVGSIAALSLAISNDASVSAVIKADALSADRVMSVSIKADAASMDTVLSGVVKADAVSADTALSALIVANYGAGQFHVVTTGQALNANTQTKITGLSVSLVASGYYEIHGQIVWSQSSPTSASAIFVFGMSASAQPVMAVFKCEGNQGIVSASTTLSVANTLIQFTGASAISAATTSAMYAVRVSAVSGAAVAGIMFFDGQLQCSTAQTQMKCWFNCSSGNFGVTIQPGSWIRAYKIG